MRLPRPRKQTASEEVRRDVQERVEVQGESLVTRDEDRMIQAHASLLQRSDGTDSSYNVSWPNSSSSSFLKCNTRPQEAVCMQQYTLLPSTDAENGEQRYKNVY